MNATDRHLTEADIPQADLPSRAKQRYLLALLAAERADKPTTSEIASRLGVAQPTALEALRGLEGGMVTRDEFDHSWSLTPYGRNVVAVLRRRYSVVERFLRSLGMEHEEAMLEAAQLGPSLSPRVEQLLRDTVWPEKLPCRAGVVR